jgi:cellulose synthase/poly-beta-1,6-N-acetylglucosamine synthase-like glycosyltransferase
MMILAASVIVILVLLLLGFELLRISFFWKNHENPPISWPTVSVLIAARNEVKFLPRLLASLEQLEYPNEKIEFLIIDDASEDQTGEIISAWCKGHVNRKGFNSLRDGVGFQGNNGKAASLATLCKEAIGDFLFFTDADCQVNSQWIKAGVSSFNPKIGIVIGITKVESNSILGKFQELEWWNTLGQVKIAADLGLQTTGLGNNMVIRKTTYDQSGGFEQTAKSLTEDLEISRLIHQTGYKLAHQISSQILAFTKAELDLNALLNQRKRWFSGVLTLPISLLILLNLQFLYLPALLFFTFHFPLLGILLFTLKLCLHGSIIRVLLFRTAQKVNWIFFLFFDFYTFLINALTILYYFYPDKISWKSRRYP